LGFVLNFKASRLAGKKKKKKKKEKEKKKGRGRNERVYLFNWF